MRRSTTVGIIVLLALAGFGVPVQAAIIPISGTFEGDATLTTTGTPGVFAQNFSGDGDDTTSGLFTPTSTSTVDFSSPPSLTISDGMLTETFANGTLFGTSSGSGTASGQGTATFSIDFVITGGTGVFAGYTGEATLMGTITQTSPTTESITGSYTGTLNTPEPSTALLLALGAAGLFGSRWQRRRQSCSRHLR